MDDRKRLYISPFFPWVDSGSRLWITPGDFQADQFENWKNPAFDHRWITPGLFATSEKAFGPVTLSLSARGDFHPEVGTQLTERIAALVKPVEDWSVRMSVGTGYAPPTAS